MPAMRGHPFDTPSIQPDVTKMRLKPASEQRQERRLARAVRTNEPDDRTANETSSTAANPPKRRVT